MLTYSVTGPEGAPPLVFLHGFLGCKEDWNETIAYLKGEFRCYAFDLPGHGASPIDAELSFPDAPLIGYSMGGRIALTHPSNAPRVLIAAHPGLDSVSDRTKRREADTKVAQDLRGLPFDVFLDKWYRLPLFATIRSRPSLYQEMLRHRRGQSPTNLAAALERFSLAKQRPNTCPPFPAQYVVGREDLKFLNLSRTLAASFEIQTIEGCGHVIPYENPKELSRAILPFLHRHSLP